MAGRKKKDAEVIEQEEVVVEDQDTIEEPEAPKEFVVTEDFTDLKNGNKIYRKGDPYFSDDESRIKELSSTNNKLGQPVIKEVE
jgi:hypothetical protein